MHVKRRRPLSVPHYPVSRPSLQALHVLVSALPRCPISLRGAIVEAEPCDRIPRTQLHARDHTALTHPRRGSRRSPSWRPPRSGTCIDCCRTSALDALRSAASSAGAFGTGTLRQAPRHAVLAVSDNAVSYISPHDSSASVRASPVDPPHPVVRRVGTRPSHAVVSSSTALARESQRAARTNHTSRRLLIRTILYQ
ncbi:hypothetical protein B0H14DRAFT_2816725 [Mycena olivaceomarginata]|nr:hypothetical protein B0H14DRAFT_2816725 [Mycena olivaceomarginata]